MSTAVNMMALKKTRQCATVDGGLLSEMMMMIVNLFNDAFRYYGHTALSEMSIHHMTREVYENMDAVKAWRMDANKQNSPPI